MSPGLPSATSTSPTPRRLWLLPALLVLLAFHFSPFGLTLDRAFFDGASRHPLREPPLPDNSALVLVDDASLAALREQGLRWPLPRAAFAGLIAALDRAGAERILVDFTFLEESEALEQDLMLAATAAASRRTVLGRTERQGPVFWTEGYMRDHAEFFTQPRTGNTTLTEDSDGVVRRYVAPGSLAVGGVAAGGDTTAGLVRWHGGLERLRERGVPVVPAGDFILQGLHTEARLAEQAPDFSPEGFARGLAAEPALTGGVFDLVRGKVVFVGTNASGTFDLKPLPVGRIEPGILLHWTAWANLHSGGLITAAPRWAALLFALAVCACLLGIASHRQGLAMPAGLAIGFAALGLAGSYAALSLGWFLPPATTIAACLLTLLGVVVERFWREQARKREIQAMFGAYVDPTVVASLVRNPASLRLGGERREATVFFSDLAGFTDLSEKLRDEPEKMVEIVNAYLEETSECLHREGAYVDKYIGDAVMAVFGAPRDQPDHARAACRAALSALRVLDDINARYAATGVTLAVRIGLNTGAMIVGNLGSSRKKNYTVMGDAVNLASRLEGANKEFGTSILLGEATARAVAGHMATRPFTRLRVKGKREAVEVHELVGPCDGLTPEQQAFLAAYLPGYTHFAERRFTEAIADLEHALAIRPDDAVTRELLRQARHFADQPPPADWEPVLTLHSK